ncbi:hypothetical protein HELRODRAFT_78647, partial [Helobdella robusta]|uniref:GATA-type domain-containing protein n=1 Tax=Helobdella robusta TaxID=6412 RepID=T1G3E1_HELRO
CENCGTTKTTAWRRSESKELLCNACGCYYKLHKVHRPLHMAHNEIRSRTRRVNRSMALTSSAMMSSLDAGNLLHDNGQQLIGEHLPGGNQQIVTS